MSRASRELYQRTVSPLIQQFSQVAFARAEEDRNKAIVEDPNSSKLQKAIAFSKLAGSQAGAQYLKTEANQSALQNLQAEENRLLGNASPVNAPQGAGGPQQATRNAANTFMNPAAFAQPGAEMGQGVPPPNAQVGGQEQPPQQPQISPEQKLEAYRRLESEAANQNLHEQAQKYRSLAEGEQKKIIAQQKLQRGIYESEKTDAQKRNEGFLKTVDGWRSSLPFSRQALSAAENAIKTGDFGPFSKNNLANLLGRPELKDATAAQLDIAAKQNLLDTISDISARFGNQWLEQVTYSAFPGYGRSPESNLTMAEAIKGSQEMKEALIKTSDQISENDRKTLGYEGPDFQKRVYEAANPILKNIADKTSYRTRSLYEDELSARDLREVSKKKPPPGTPLTRKMFQVFLSKTGAPEKAIENAKKMGYIIYPNSRVEEFTR